MDPKVYVPEWADPGRPGRRGSHGYLELQRQRNERGERVADTAVHLWGLGFDADAADPSAI